MEYKMERFLRKRQTCLLSKNIDKIQIFTDTLLCYFAHRFTADVCEIFFSSWGARRTSPIWIYYYLNIQSFAWIKICPKLAINMIWERKYLNKPHRFSDTESVILMSPACCMSSPKFLLSFLWSLNCVSAFFSLSGALQCSTEDPEVQIERRVSDLTWDKETTRKHTLTLLYVGCVGFCHSSVASFFLFLPVLPVNHASH